MTRIQAREGKLYLAAIKDAHTRRIVGYAAGKRMTAPLVAAALSQALQSRGYPTGVTIHSDQGGQYRSRLWRTLLESHRLIGSMGNKGAPGDNAAMESFFSLLQNNVLNTKSWETRTQLRAAITHWVEAKYHRKRKQSSLGKHTPIEYEIQWNQAQAA